VRELYFYHYLLVAGFRFFTVLVLASRHSIICGMMP
jgi:hypothetical protein